EYLAYVVAKNVGWFHIPDTQNDQRFKWQREWTRLDQGMVDWRAILAELKTARFAGPICMHNFYQNTLEGLTEGAKADVRFLRGLMRDTWNAG
ncbi:unnamed protein product, partial [marine sediment metagenome]